MNETPNSSVTSRREFLKTTGKIAAASALAGVALPSVHAAGSDLIQICLIGCGGRGGGAAANALSTQKGPVKLVAMADVFEDKLNNCYKGLERSNVNHLVDVPPDRKFIGFDGYKRAMDTLKKGDVAIFTTPLAFRWVHFTYAIEKGLNVFMEKPLSADGPSSRKLVKLAKEASAKNLKCGVGLMSRHSRALQELHSRIQDGEIGDVVLMRGYRMHGPVGSAFSTKWTGEPNSELLWQIRRFHSFLWASGGCFNDFYIHHVDHLCWMKNDWPVKAQALGGRHYKLASDGSPYVDQNFDTYSVEYTFKDGSKFIMDGRCMNGAHPIYSSYVHGSKGIAIASKANDCGLPSSTYHGQNPDKEHVIWTSEVKKEEQDPYLNEWNDLMDAIRLDKPYNEVERGVYASNTCNMGRMAAHTAQEITFEQALNHEHVYAPGIEDWTMDSPPPLHHDANGRYPIPMPGEITNREYGDLAV
jgi:predicted dehydrogenase